jgi:serine/threonine protein kinase/formylglycine-generating enzyme required for sulfatase activity
MRAKRQMTWAPPDEFEEYRIVRSLGAGTMGLVFLAHDTLLDRPVAIKFINTLDIGPITRDRFFTEARAVARLSHPNVVAIHRVGEIKQRPYLVSEYVRGISLASVPKPMPWQRALKIALGLARGLGAAHRAGVLHRDIKPANVMLGDDDEAKLLDFGLAKLSSMSPVPQPDSAPGRSSGDHDAMHRPELDEAHQAMDETLSIPTPLEPPAVHLDASTTALVDHGTHHTRDGAILGTPLYLAPELWNGAPASQASDVYALGVVLYELLAGRAPHAGLSMSELAARVPAEDAPPIASQLADLPAQLAQLVDAAVARDPARRPISGDALCDLLELVGPRAPLILPGSPYRGLSTFESEHRALFFGRTAETRAVVERLRTETFVIVAGDSGVGKSSLCRAAVLPAVAEKSLGGTRWRVTAILPGTRPLARIEAALAERRSDEGLLLFIDQLEELLTIAEPDECARFAQRLAELVVATSAVRVLASARSDFLGRLAGLPGLGELVGRALFLLGPLNDRGLFDAVVGPAQASGYSFESAATVSELVASGRRHLPLLQFALSELWDARDQARKVIPADALARVGGVTGALARHADTVLAGLPAAERSAARAILLALVTAEGTRARRSQSELAELASRTSPRASAALDALVRGRLLVAHETESGEESDYSIAHEALLQGWDTLQNWLGEDAQGRSTRQRIERAAAEWDRLGRPRDALWNDRLLLETAGVADATLPARDVAFLHASRHASARRRARRWSAILGTPIAIAGIMLALHMKGVYERRAIIDDARRMLSAARLERDRFERLRSDAFTRFDSSDELHAELRWREVLVAGPAAERAYADTAERLERMLQDQPASSPEGRVLLSDVLFERAVLAENSGRILERDDLVRRLGVYGSAERWKAPARLSIATRPAGAVVTMRRYELVSSRWVELPATRLGTTPIDELPLAPGSVVLELSRPDRVGVRLPVLLPRGDAARVDIRLPAPAEIPPGFVYIAEGQFLYGSAGSEEARSFYESQPLHAVGTGAYLIAVHETTFGEWIEFLRALPAAERAARAPRVSRQGFTIALEETASHQYQLTLGPDDHPYVAAEDEPIRYPGRTSRAVQAWSRLPVSGVSFNDALAYTRWLGATGRVPNARPCAEHEWERAARGADGRAYPHGERLEPDDANFDLTYGRNPTAFGPDEVGSHPASDSPFGVHDLAGNVWEWTASTANPQLPVARGGSFFQLGAVARPENRSQDIADRRDAFYGVRVCASVGARAGDER